MVKIGIKVWICKGEVLAKRDLNPNFVGGKSEVSDRATEVVKEEEMTAEGGGQRDDRRGGGGGDRPRWRRKKWWTAESQVTGDKLDL